MSWQINNKIAHLDRLPWSAQMDLEHPERGLAWQRSHSTFRGVKLSLGKAGHSFQLGDSYTRHNDLTVLYTAHKDQNFNVQLDFRVVECEVDFVRCEVWLSIHTHLLDTHPAVGVAFELEMENVPKIFSDTDGTLHNSAANVAHPAVAGWTATEPESWTSLLMIHPLDQADVDWHWQAEASKQDSQRQLNLVWFGDHMEKGVIRRGRMQLVLSGRPTTDSEVQHWYNQFAESPLPLTT